MKKNKKIIVLSIVLVLCVLLVGIIYYICYDGFSNDDEVKDFYVVSNLEKNKYIKKINDKVSYLGNDPVIEIKDNDLYVVSNNSLNKVKGISGSLKYVYFSMSGDNNSNMFLVLTEEGDLYGASSYNGLVKDFIKINSVKVKDIYDFNYGLGNVINYPVKPLTVYALLEDNSLKSVSFDNNTIKMNDSTFEDDFPNPDVIMGGICNGSIDSWCSALYISANGNLFFNKSAYGKTPSFKEISFKKKSLKVKEAFSKTIKKSNIDEIEKIEYYVIDQKNNIYIIKMDSDYKFLSIDKFKDKKIKSYKYNPDTKVISIMYNDDSNESINIDNISSLYYRYNN